MSGFMTFRRIGTAQLRRYVPGEDISHVRVALGTGPVPISGWIARDPDNHSDQWFVTDRYFYKNFDPHPLHNASEIQ